MRILLPTLLLALSTSCATILTDEDVEVGVHCEPKGSHVVVTDRDGNEVYSATTPTKVDLEKGAGYFGGQDYTFTFSAPGYENRAVTLETSVRKWYLFGNLLFGGIIGWFIVDPATGAMWKMDDEVHVALRAVTS